jgi:hypothetical protein
MQLNEFHTSHIGKVEVGFIISGKDLIPSEVTKALQLQPDHCASKDSEKYNYSGKVVGKHSVGFWRIDTKKTVQSKDINDHFRYLLSRLLPHKEVILDFAKNGETFFDVLWQSSYLYAGTGPLIASDCLQGISQLQAGVGFDIYQIEELNNS